MAANQLRRSLSLPLLTLYGLGTILGAGIYVLVGKVAGTAGVYAPVAFLVAALLAAFTAYSFALLSGQYPRAAGEVYYVEQAFGRKSLARMTGWAVVLTGIISSATITRGFIGYFAVFATVPDAIMVIGLLTVLVALACWGVTQSVAVAAAITVVEIVGLLVIIVLAGGVLQELPARAASLIPPLNTDIWLAILSASFLAFYAFMGFEDMVNMAEEVKDPERNMPRGIILALIIASLLYVTVALVAVLALPIETLSNTDAPMVALLAPYGQNAERAIGIISLIAVINGALLQLIMAARVIYGMAQQALAPAFFARIHPRTQTPISATVLVGILICIAALVLPLVTLAKLTSFIVLSIFTLINLAQATLHLRQHGKSHHKRRWIIPLLGSLFCLLLLTLQISLSV